MTIDNHKYVVMKRYNWDLFLAGLEHLGVSESQLPRLIDDAVIIRRQDVFAPPALAAYANAIQTALAIHVDSGSYVPGVDEEPESVKHLKEIADYFHEQSELAYADSARKIPD